MQDYEPNYRIKVSLPKWDTELFEGSADSLTEAITIATHYNSLTLSAVTIINNRTNKVEARIETPCSHENTIDVAMDDRSLYICTDCGANGKNIQSKLQGISN
jgi:hypothetical protein